MDFMLGTVAKIDKVGLVKQGEELGYSHFGAGEGPLLFSEPYEFLAIAARETKSIQLGTWVTNPLTRLLPQTANAIATLNALAPGRVFLGIGAANNAMRSMGLRTARVAELEAVVQGIRTLLEGKRLLYQWENNERYIEFLDPQGGWYNIADSIPVFVPAGGPKSLVMASRVADGVGYCLGPDTNLIRIVRKEMDEAATKAGRDPKSVKLIAVTWFYMLRPGESREEAITKGFGSGPLSSCFTNIQLMRQHASELDETLMRDSEQATAAYLGVQGDQQTVHLDVWKSYMQGLDPRTIPLITQKVIDSFCICGTPDQCLTQVRQMADAGIDGINIFLSNPHTVERDAKDFAECVIHRW